MINEETSQNVLNNTINLKQWLTDKEFGCVKDLPTNKEDLSNMIANEKTSSYMKKINDKLLVIDVVFFNTHMFIGYSDIAYDMKNEAFARAKANPEEITYESCSEDTVLIEAVKSFINDCKTNLTNSENQRLEALKEEALNFEKTWNELSKI